VGLWWKKVDVEAPPTGDGVVWFAGDRKAMSKRIPILWRFNQNYHLLKVDPRSGRYYKTGYFIYFASGNTVMRYRTRLHSGYIAVRVGPEPVRFWIEKDNHDNTRLRLRKTDYIFSGLNHSLVGNMHYEREIEATALRQQAIFV